MRGRRQRWSQRRPGGADDGARRMRGRARHRSAKPHRTARLAARARHHFRRAAGEMDARRPHGGDVPTVGGHDRSRGAGRRAARVARARLRPDRRNPGLRRRHRRRSACSI